VEETQSAGSYSLREARAYLAVDELDVARTLGVAVTSTVLGTGLVAGEPGHATVSIHLTQVEGAVETAGELRNIDGESELLVQELEHCVLCLTVQEVDTRADVGSRYEAEREGVAGGRDTVGGIVLGTVEGTVRSAGHGVGAESSVPLVACVAVGVAANGVEPAPVGVEHNGGRLGDTSSTGRALLRGKLGVGLSRLSAGLLTVHYGSERECQESGCAEHFSAGNG
jgi:hypothetical protein